MFCLPGRLRRQSDKKQTKHKAHISPKLLLPVLYYLIVIIESDRVALRQVEVTGSTRMSDVGRSLFHADFFGGSSILT